MLAKDVYYKSEQNLSNALMQNMGFTDRSSPCHTCMLQKNCIISRIESTPEKGALHLSHRSTLIKDNKHLYFSGDQLQAIYIIKSGSFKSYTTNQKGDEQIIDFHLPGDILGLDALPLHRFEYSAVALEASSVCAVPAQQLEHLIDSLVPDWLMELMMGKLIQQQRNHSALGKKNARRQIASFILDQSENYRALGYSGKELKLNMSRQDIGNYLGLASETISRIFTRMQKEGLLKLDRKEITIVDFENLSQLADKTCLHN